ncbi:hypothetical protein BGZ63DRAFT_371642 [Mariannaea sp. PMI_226]|nr:hypothetical protein BGZ63DRAFT_371642 [Mariannaea sp. PMI_226]
MASLRYVAGAVPLGSVLGTGLTSEITKSSELTLQSVTLVGTEPLIRHALSAICYDYSATTSLTTSMSRLEAVDPGGDFFPCSTPRGRLK